MRQKMRALKRTRPVIGALVALLALAMAPVATAKSPPAGSHGGSQGSARAGERLSGLLALGTGFHRSGASERVREVQKGLNRLGYGAGAVDGLFGPLTDAAVRRFQADHGLAVDGIAGPQTLGRLRAVERRSERLLARGSGFKRSGGSERVRVVQRRLEAKGFEAGAVDGLFGPLTDAAVRRFQAQSGLVVDGIVGPRTLIALGPLPARVRTRSANPPPATATPNAGTGARSPGRAKTPRGQATPAKPSPPANGPGPLPQAKKAGLRWDIVIPIAALIGLFAVILVALGGDRSGEERAKSASRPGPEPEPNGGPLAEAGADPPPGAWRTELVNVPHAGRLYGIGARAHPAGKIEVGSNSGVIYVELTMFAEGQRRRWETDPLDGGAPFSVSVKDLEQSVREIVVPDRLATLARTMRNAGISVQASDLEPLAFMLELTPELEAELVRRRLAVRV